MKTTDEYRQGPAPKSEAETLRDEYVQRSHADVNGGDRTPTKQDKD